MIEQIMTEELGEKPLPCVVKKRLKVQAAGVGEPRVSGEMGELSLVCVPRKATKGKARDNDYSDDNLD